MNTQKQPYKCACVCVRACAYVRACVRACVCVIYMCLDVESCINLTGDGGGGGGGGGGNFSNIWNTVGLSS